MSVSEVRDYTPSSKDFLDDVVSGLSDRPKTLPCKYFYDERGSQLFERITQLDEYYPTRTEISIMRENGPAIAREIGPDVLLIELGSGGSIKTRVLLDHLDRPAGYVPIDISREHLIQSARQLAELYPNIEIMPVSADYMHDLWIPEPRRRALRRVVYFPGSTIGNFHEEQAVALLQRIASLCGADGALLIGVDLRKSTELLEAAYNDTEDVTAEFNLNLLRRINRELAADFKIHRFAHRAVFNELLGRVEMHLLSMSPQEVHINGATSFHFERGESIRTECSYKYSLDEFASLVDRAGFGIKQIWTDRDGYFSVQLLAVK